MAWARDGIDPSCHLHPVTGWWDSATGPEGRVDGEQLGPDDLSAPEPEPRGIRETSNALSIGEGGCVSACEEKRAERDVQLVDESFPNQRLVQFPTPFAEEASDTIFAVETSESPSEIDR